MIDFFQWRINAKLDYCGKAYYKITVGKFITKSEIGLGKVK